MSSAPTASLFAGIIVTGNALIEVYEIPAVAPTP
jgi:hypothetical protein